MPIPESTTVVLKEPRFPENIGAVARAMHNMGFSRLVVVNPDYWMNKIRAFGSHMKLRAREVSIIRGICRQIDWYGEKRYRDGVRDDKRLTDARLLGKYPYRVCRCV